MASAEKLKEIKDEYTSSLSDLTINSKPLINMLTMLAEDYMENASVIVQAVEEHLEKVRSEYKLPVLYLIDSIVKNVGHAYTTLFTQNIVANFCGVFEKVDERIRSQMFKLRQTWSEVFPAKKMYALDVRVNAIDPAWPIIAPPPTPSIHVNPKFFNKNPGTTATTTPSTTSVTTTAPVDSTLDMRAQLISKQKELLELQQRKIELELLQAKVKLEEQQKQYAMTQKSQRKNSPTITTTTSTTTTLPSMKTMLTKPAVLSTVNKSSETKTSSSKQSMKVSSQISQAFSTPKVIPTSTNGPRITPVNSALISASSRNVSRDPRLAAKQAIQQQQQQTQNTTANIEKLVIKSSKSSNNEPVNIEKSDSKQKNNLEVSNKVTKVTQPPTTSLPIKDPRLLSSKVHGGNIQSSNTSSSNTTTSVGNKSGKSGSRTFCSGNSRLKESGIPVSNRNKSKSKQKGGKQSEQVANKVVDINDVNVNKFSKLKSSNDSLKTPCSSSVLRSPIKSKRKERNNSPLKKSPQSSSSESPSTKRSPHSKHSKNRHSNNKYDVDMDICNSPTPPPPAPPSVGNLVESTSPSTNKIDDKSFKDLKGSTKSRNYIRRNRDMSHSPDGVSPSKDIDLRVGGAPPEKQARLQSPVPQDTDSIGSILVPENNLKNSITDQIIREVSVAASKDVDLRQLPSATVPALIGKKRSSTDKLETSNPKKSKAEMFDVLFGNEDVDLRTLPPKMTSVPPVQPPTPPPPVISSPTSSINNDEWQKVKETKPSPTSSQHSPQSSPSPTLNTPNTHLATVRAKLANATNRDRLGRPLLYNKLPDDPKERKRTISTTGDVDLRRLQKPPPIKTDAAIKLFLQQVEEEHKSGKMSQAQYQNAMEQVITILERQKLRKAKRMESLNDSLSGSGEMNLSLQPISDDELSVDYSEEDDELEKMSTKDVDDRQLHIVTNLANTLEVDKIDLTSPNSSYGSDGKSVKSNENTTIDLTLPSKDDRDRRGSEERDRERDERPPRSRRWDGGGNESWNRQPIRSPWLHPPLGLMEKQNPYSTPWKSPFIAGAMPPITGGISLHGSAKDLLENRPNVAVGGFVQRPPVVRYGPRSASPPAIGSQTTRELPHADQLVLEYINNDSMRTINIDGNPTEIRYYGDTAITMKGDEAREISFQNGTRRITFGEKESYVLAFNDVAREVMIAGVTHRIRLGAPTRELYIDDKWYECFFGGPGIVIEIDREYRVVKLEGPPPQVKIGNKRSDLCVGRINLIINAKNIVPIFLDAKPQKFDIEGKIHTLRFVDALRTVLINEEPFKVDFGGLPKPIIVHNKKHFIRFTRLPPGIKPGYVDIKDMEGQRFPGSPPRAENENSMDRLVPVTEATTVPSEIITNEPALPMFGKRRPLDIVDQPTVTGSPDNRVSSPTQNNPVLTSNLLKNFNLDLLSSIITPAMAPSSNINASGYNTDLLVNSSSDSTNPSEIPGLGGISQPAQPLPPPATQLQTPAIGLTAPPRSLEELTELIQKLEATGILSNVSESLKTKEPNPIEVQDNTIKPVDFAQPETLKAKQPAIIAALYSGMQCSSCGVRFPPEHTMKYSRQHLDWHYRQNKKKKHSVRKANSRKWFYDVSDWIQFEEIEDLEEREKSWFENQQAAASGTENNGEATEETPEEIEIPSVDARSAGENPRCDVCYDAFDQFYNEEKEEWHLKMAIRVDDKLYHPLCYEDYKVSLLETEPLEEIINEETLIEIRDETDENTNEEDVKEIKEKEVEPVIIDDEEIHKPDEDNIDNIPPLLSNDENINNETKASEDVVVETVESDDLDTSEQDVCIILPEEEIPIVKIDDNADDEDEEDVFKENESSNESTQNVVKHKMMDVILADGSVVKIKSEPLDTDVDEPSEEIASTTADNSQISVQSSIDGNVQLDSTVNIGSSVPSGKIKINISKPLILSSQSNSQSKEMSDLSKSHTIADLLDSSEPPPPGEEPPLQIKLKPALQGVNLKVIPPVSKGSELSGLCSIM